MGRRKKREREGDALGMGAAGRKEVRHMMAVNSRFKVRYFFWREVRCYFLSFSVFWCIFLWGGGVSVKAAFVHESYCSVEVASVDDLYSERAKVKVYVVNSFVGRW